MKLRDIYKHKKYNNFIRISSFATPINKSLDFKEDLYIIVENLQVIDGNVSSCPSFNMYGTQEDIEQDYELYRDADTITWDTYEEVFDKIKEMIEDQDRKYKKEIEDAFNRLSTEELKSLQQDIDKIIADK